MEQWINISWTNDVYAVSGKRTNGKNITRCCNGQCKQSYGYHWKWAEKSVTTSSNERKEKGENPSSEVQDINDIV